MRPAPPSSPPPTVSPSGGADSARTAVRRARERPPVAEPAREHAACLAALGSLGVAFEPVEPVADETEPGCGIARPLRVTSAGEGIALRPEAILRCSAARAMGEWVRDHVAPAASRLPEREGLSGIDHGSAYACRRRGNRPGGKLSEHALGNALDVMGFRFADGSRLPVAPRTGDAAETRFQRTVREGSCEHFTTVLGPGSNAAHADHFHLDIARRRGGYRLCD